MMVEVKELKTERLGFIVDYEHEFDREFESGSITRGTAITTTKRMTSGQLSELWYVP